MFGFTYFVKLGFCKIQNNSLKLPFLDEFRGF